MENSTIISASDSGDESSFPSSSLVSASLQKAGNTSRPAAVRNSLEDAKLGVPSAAIAGMIPSLPPQPKPLPSQSQTIETSDLECSLCFRLFCRPVSTPCGHTYCKSCLLSALQYSLLCPLCRCKLEPPTKYKYSINIVILNLLEKHFKEEHEQRDKEEEEDEEQEKQNAAENPTLELEDYYTRWSNCLIPSVRETCSVLLSCT